MKGTAPKILVVLTGGTIGSRCSDGVRSVDGSSPYILIREFRRRFPAYSACEFDIVNPYSILSEDLTCDRWSMLCRALESADASLYDGIIVTHGSDTLAYTAAAVGMLMRHTGLPIVLTAADRPPEDERGNAMPNFRASVDFILGSGLKGVYVSYRRRSGEQAIYLATRLRSADCFLDEFSSYGGGCLGAMREGAFVPDNSEVNPTAEELLAPVEPLAGRDADTGRAGVMLLRSYPGLDYSAVNPEGFAAVVNYGYHCATACTVGSGTSLTAFAERCRECGTALWLGSFKAAESEIYSTQQGMAQDGILPFYDMSPEAAYVKAVLAYNLPGVEPVSFMRSCVYYEMPGKALDCR